MVNRGSGWWRRSRGGLFALLILVPAAVVASLSIDAFDYLASRPALVTTLDRGASAQLGAATIRVVDTWTAPADAMRGVRYAVPEGTALVSVTLELDASEADEDFVCTVKLTQPERDRHWTSWFTDTDYFPGEGLPDDVPSGCRHAQLPYPFELTFLIPEDAVGHVVLEAVTPDLLPRAYHLRLS